MNRKSAWITGAASVEQCRSDIRTLEHPSRVAVSDDRYSARKRLCEFRRRNQRLSSPPVLHDDDCTLSATSVLVQN